MSEIEATEPEPVRDLIMQFCCLADPSHPKRAVWTTAGQRLPLSSAGVARLRLPAGSLFAGVHLCRRLARDPSAETLARILGYVECKSAVGSGDLPVVQALTQDGWVVWEQLSSWGRVGEARAVAARYGAVRVVGMAACLARRRALIGEELGDAVKIGEAGAVDGGCGA